MCFDLSQKGELFQKNGMEAVAVFHAVDVREVFITV